MTRRDPMRLACGVRALLLFLAGALAVASSAGSEITCRDSWQGEACRATTSDGRSAQWPLDGRVPLLQSFDIRFSRSDRPVRELTVGAIDERFFRFELRDRDGGEPIDGAARFVDLAPLRRHWRQMCGLPRDTPIVRIRTASETDCRGRCVVAEEPNPHVGACRWSRFVTGFSLRFTEPRARQLREVSVWRTESGRLEAAFRNDGERQLFDADIGYVDIPIPPPPAPGGLPLFRVVGIGNNVRPRGSRSPGGDHTPLRLLFNDTWWQDRYLRGFQIRRTGDDANLKRFLVDVQEEPVTVRFEDDDGREDVLFRVLLGEFVYRIE